MAIVTVLLALLPFRITCTGTAQPSCAVAGTVK
jgi:hypothetical protein